MNAPTPFSFFSQRPSRIRENGRLLPDTVAVRSPPYSLPLTGLPEWLPGLDIRGTIHRLMGNRDLYLKLLHQMAREHGAWVEECALAWQNGRQEEAIRHAHSIKGLAANLGALELSAAAAQLESALHESLPPQWIAELLGLCQQQTRTVLATIALLPQTLSPDRSIPREEDSSTQNLPLPPPERLAAWLDELHELIKHNDLQASQRASHFHQQLQGTLMASSASTLEELLLNFRFKDAAQLLLQIQPLIILPDSKRNIP